MIYLLALYASLVTKTSQIEERNTDRGKMGRVRGSKAR